MNIFALILGILALAAFAGEWFEHRRGTVRTAYIALGLFFATAAGMVQLLTVTHNIHF